MRVTIPSFKACLPNDQKSPFVIRKHYDISKQDEGFTVVAHTFCVIFGH
jgi:hypothetical protein